MIYILLITLFLLGFCAGMLYEKREEMKRKPNDPVGVETPYKPTRPRTTKVNFADQLDPVIPEGTLRPLFKEKEVEDE